MFAAFSYQSPNIVSDGLVLHLDSSDRTSYNTTNTFVNNLVPNTMPTMSLINTPVYSSSFGGYLGFNGINQSGLIPYNTTYAFNGTSSYTAEVWVYPQPMANGQSYFVIFGRYDSAVGGNHGWDISYTQNTANVPASSGSAFVYCERLGGAVSRNVNELVPTSSYYNNWQHLVLTYTGVSMSFYRNGVFKGATAAAFTSSQTTAPYRIAARPSTSPTVFTNTRISTLRLYNRALSTAEVSQNFNAQRQRYGI